MVSAGIFLLGFASCKDQINTGDSPSSIIFPSSNISYGQSVQPLFNQTCTFSGCHDAAATTTVQLTTYGGLMFGPNSPGVVIAKDPANSKLVMSIEARLQRMPPSGNLLNQNQINGIRAWIVEGAKNN